MVDNDNATKLFAPKNISRFAKSHAKLLYAIVGQAIPNTDSEYATIGLALTPEEAYKMCTNSMGDAIEVWVIEGDQGLLSEKWEPRYFREHFNEIVEYTRPASKEEEESTDDDEIFGRRLEDDPRVDEEELDEGIKLLDKLLGNASQQPEMGIEMPQEVLMGKALLQLLELEQTFAKTVAATSYMTGHPVEVNELLLNLHEAIVKILSAFAQSKGGFEPKFRKKDGIVVPYWTKTQIKQAKIKK